MTQFLGNTKKSSWPRGGPIKAGQARSSVGKGTEENTIYSVYLGALPETNVTVNLFLTDPL